MPSNHDFICFDHRVARRGGLFSRPERCPIDGAPLIDIGYRERVPKKTDNKGWRRLQGLFGAGIGGDDVSG